MNQSQVTTLFGYPIWISKIDSSLYNKKQIVDAININYDKDPNRNYWNKIRPDYTKESNLHHSYLNEDNPDMLQIDYSIISNVYTSKIQQFMNENNIRGKFKFSILNYTVINNHQSMQAHSHIDACSDTCFAAVHYLSYEPNKHSPIVFINNNPLMEVLASSQLNNMIDHKNTIFKYLNASYQVTPEEDDIIIFPSCLLHSVPSSKQICNKNRICIALNIQMRE